MIGTENGLMLLDRSGQNKGEFLLHFIHHIYRGKVEQVQTFQYLGALFDSDATYKTEVKSHILQGRQRMGQLNRLWRSRTLSPKLKARLILTLFWPIVTYGAEVWTLNKELTGNAEAFEMWCYRRAMRISYVEHISNDEVLRREKNTSIYRQIQRQTRLTASFYHSN